MSMCPLYRRAHSLMIRASTCCVPPILTLGEHCRSRGTWWHHWMHLRHARSLARIWGELWCLQRGTIEPHGYANPCNVLFIMAHWVSHCFIYMFSMEISVARTVVCGLFIYTITICLQNNALNTTWWIIWYKGDKFNHTIAKNVSLLKVLAFIIIIISSRFNSSVLQLLFICHCLSSEICIY